MNTLQSEKELYERVYKEIPEYNTYSPAESIAPLMLGIAKQMGCKTILDAGCGKGQLIPIFTDAGYEITGVDHTLSGLFPHVDKEKCVEFPLSDLPFNDDYFDLVICVDVLEHIPQELLRDSIKEMSRVCSGYALFKIALFKDGYGNKIGERLHKSILDVKTWNLTLGMYFSKIIELERFGGDLTVLCRA